MAGLVDVFKLDYQANLEMALQQMGSRLDKFCMQFTGLEGAKAKLENRVGDQDYQRNTESFRDVTLGQPDIESRWVTYDRGIYETGVETIEKIKSGIDPTGAYVKNGMYTLGRFLDDQIITAALGNAITGTDGTTTTALPTSSIITAGGTGLTRGKLDSVQERLEIAEVDLDQEMVTMVMSPQAHTDLRNITDYVNWDTNSARPLEGHAPKPFMGIHNFVISNRLGINGNIRDCIVFTSKGLGVGKFGQGMESDVRRLPNKTGAPYLIEAQMHANATRLDEKRVLKVQIDESV